MLACFPTCFATNILTENKKKEEIDTDLKCKIEDWSCELRLKAGPTRPQLAPKKLLEVRIQRNRSEMVKIKPQDHFIGPCMA